VISHSREVGGAEVYLENLVRFLKESGGWQVGLVCRRDAILDAWADQISKYCDVARLDVTRPDDVRRLVGLARESDLVHLNLSFPSGKYQFAAAGAVRLAGRPLVVTHHLALIVSGGWRLLMRWLGRAAISHIAVSRHARDVLIKDYGYRPARVVVVHNGIDIDLFRPASANERGALRRTVGEALDGRPWGDDVLLACTVARLSTQKGLFDLVEAGEAIVKMVPQARMVVIGEGNQRPRLLSEVRARGLEHSFYLAGAMPRARVAEWLAAADVFILPSRYEGGPATALMEAMAAGCAVVATNVNGTDELVTDSTLGRLVPARDPAALAEATIGLMSDPKARAEMGERARRRVIEAFTIEACLTHTVAIFEAAVHA
jgi:glycosyltransferase involved in cell wall biosynthesis